MGQIRVGGFQGLGQAEALDLLSDFRTNHMGAQQLATFGVEHGLYKPFCLTDGRALPLACRLKRPKPELFTRILARPRLVARASSFVPAHRVYRRF